MRIYLYYVPAGVYQCTCSNDENSNRGLCTCFYFPAEPFPSFGYFERTKCFMAFITHTKTPSLTSHYIDVIKRNIDYMRITKGHNLCDL